MNELTEQLIGKVEPQRDEDEAVPNRTLSPAALSLLTGEVSGPP